MNISRPLLLQATHAMSQIGLILYASTCTAVLEGTLFKALYAGLEHASVGFTLSG
jgi:hypothetical protein